MTHGRRTIDRRRRVLYTAHHADPSVRGAAQRRTAARLRREAKRSTAAYGARVHRRLQGRWFSLVPVRRRSLLGAASSLLLLAMLLTAAHYAAVAWPPIASRPALAGPLRLDRPDSFGRWVHTLMWAAAAGASLMIYQLRRYRLDDYLGHYRIWRVVLLAALAASINSVASAVDWSGAVLDAVFGRRVALSGQDWIRLLLTLGGAVLALRVTVEVRRCRGAMLTMIAVWALLAIPVAATWNLLAVDGLTSWMLVTSAPLLASTLLLIALGGYLRQLYREVRQIEPSEPLWQRARRLGRDLLHAPGQEETTGSQADSETARERNASRRWLSRWRTRGQASNESAPAPDDPSDRQRGRRETAKKRKAHRQAAVDTGDDPRHGDVTEADTSAPPARRRWFGLRRAKTIAPDAPESRDGEMDSDESREHGGASDRSDAKQPQDSNETKPKRRRFAMRWRRKSRETDAEADKSVAEAEADGEEDSPDDHGEDEPASSGRGRFGALRPSRWLRRRSQSDASIEEDAPESASPSPRGADEPVQAGSGEASDEDDAWIDPDEIDWSSLSKTQRRRLRKQLRRQGEAA